MLRPQIRIHSAREFPPRAPETTPENDGIALSYGLGWGLFSTPHGRAFFKEGHDDGWQHHTVVFDDAGVAIAIMTDSDSGDRTFRALLAALGDTSTPWRWEGYAAEP
jgi:D-alanyl-D-alanine-carboxypeptidase/D-alanyl-D-alanine-endopeptidase